MQEMLEAAKKESEANAGNDLKAWAAEFPDAATKLKALWTRHLVLGHKALARMLLDKPPKAKKPTSNEEE